MKRGQIPLPWLIETSMNTRIITWYIGISLLLVCALMTVSAVIACITPGDESRIPLIYSAFLTGVIGIFPVIFVSPGSHRLNFREGNCIVVCAWVAGCLFGMLPYLFYGGEFSWVNALFESVSGFTTTGASILTDIEALPRGLLFWRNSTAWVGGIGIVTLFSRIIFGGSVRSMLSGSEISDVALQSFSGQRSEFFANRMLVVYIGLTIVAFAALRAVGIGWFEAATTAMSATSTCGFCTRNESIASFHNPAAEVILIVIMLASGINFSMIFLSCVKARHFHLFSSEVVRSFLWMFAASTAIVYIDLFVSGGYLRAGATLREEAFQVASLVTTTGFATADTNLWPPLSMSVLVACSLVCGCSGSTSGGIKTDRIVLVRKEIVRKIKNYVTPHSVHSVQIDGHARSEEQIGDAEAFLFCYFMILVLFGIVNVAGGLDFVTGLTASIACIGNVGPGFGDVGSMDNYSQVPTLLKFTSMAEMLIGRLEIFPVLYLFRSFR